MAKPRARRLRLCCVHILPTLARVRMGRGEAPAGSARSRRRFYRCLAFVRWSSDPPCAVAAKRRGSRRLDCGVQWKILYGDLDLARRKPEDHLVQEGAAWRRKSRSSDIRLKSWRTW